MSDQGNKVILVSLSGYSSEKIGILRGLIADRVALFCVVGRDCEIWHDVMDELCVGDGTDPVDMLTTWHPDEPIEDVIEFAKTCSVENDDGVRIIEV